MKTIHDVRESFSLEKFLEARRLTKEAVKVVSQNVFVGMTETDGHKIIDETLEKMGAQKKWHPNKFRIGHNTTKSFRDLSDVNICLAQNDIYFIDIGPVWDNHEGDYGETFVVGENETLNRLREDTKIVFEKTAAAWKEEKLSGRKLYDYARECAQSHGHNLNERMKGHRIGDFPHHLFYKGGMSEIDETPCDNLWILEIHLITKDSLYGGFYEDILRS